MFQMRNLSVLSYANGFSMWLYVTNTETVRNTECALDYFQPAICCFHDGDVVVIKAKDGTAMRSVCIHKDIVAIRPMM